MTITTPQVRVFAPHDSADTRRLSALLGAGPGAYVWNVVSYRSEFQAEAMALNGGIDIDRVPTDVFANAVVLVELSNDNVHPKLSG